MDPATIFYLFGCIGNWSLIKIPIQFWISSYLKPYNTIQFSDLPKFNNSIQYRTLCIVFQYNSPCIGQPCWLFRGFKRTILRSWAYVRLGWAWLILCLCWRGGDNPISFFIFLLVALILCCMLWVKMHNQPSNLSMFSRISAPWTLINLSFASLHINLVLKNICIFLNLKKKWFPLLLTRPTKASLLFLFTRKCD